MASGITLTGEEDIEVIVNDLNMELRGRIERGGGFAISGGGFDTKEASGKERLSVEDA